MIEGAPPKTSATFALTILLGFDYAKYRGIDLLEKLEGQAIWFRWSIYIIAIFSVLIFGVG